MAPENLFTVFSTVAPEVSGSGTRIQVLRQGDYLRFYTGERYLRRSRLFARLVGILFLAAGIGLAWLSLWALALIAPGLLIFLLVPRALKPSLLVEIDGTRRLLFPVQPSLRTGSPVLLEQVQSIRAAYDTKGWDSFSMLYAVLDDGEAIPFLMFLGTDEALVETACRLLGQLLDCPATYLGPFGHTTTCYVPAC